MYTILGLIISTSYLFEFNIFEQTPNVAEFFQQDLSSQRPKSELLIELIKYDFENLIAQRYIPPKLTNVRRIRFHNRSNLRPKKNDLRNFIPTNASGNYLVKTEVYPFPNEKNSYLVQFDWVDLRDNNKVWEMNRVYKLEKMLAHEKKNLGKKKPDQ